MVSTCVCVARTVSRSGPLADLALLDRLEAHLPDGQSLTDLPPGSGCRRQHGVARVE